MILGGRQANCWTVSKPVCVCVYKEYCWNRIPACSIAPVRDISPSFPSPWDFQWKKNICGVICRSLSDLVVHSLLKLWWLNVARITSSPEPNPLNLLGRLVFSLQLIHQIGRPTADEIYSVDTLSQCLTWACSAVSAGLFSCFQLKSDLWGDFPPKRLISHSSPQPDDISPKTDVD